MRSVFHQTLVSFVGQNVSYEDVVKQGGLDYEVEKCPLKAVRPTWYGEQTMDHIVAIYRKDNGMILSAKGVGKNYGIVQVPEALAFCEHLVKDKYAEFGYAGAPGGGAKAYIALRAAGNIQVSGTHSIENWFTVSTSHDGSSRVEVKVTPIFSMTNVVLIPGQVKHLTFKHTRNVKTRIGQAMKTISRVTAEWDRMELELRQMMATTITTEQAGEYFEDVIGSEDIENSTKGQNILERMKEIYESGTYAIIPAMHGTVFGAYAAVLEWCDKEKTVKKSKARPDASEALLYTKIDGAAAKQKAEAYAFAWKLCQLSPLMGEE